MILLRKISSVGISILAILGLSTTMAFAQPTSESSSSPNEQVLELDQADAEGFEATFEDGNIQENQDGSLTLINDTGDTIARLDTQFRLASGKVIEVSYAVDDDNINAEYETGLTPEEADEFVFDPSESQAQNGSQLRANGVTCGLAVAGAAGSYIGGAGAALTAPFTAGGGLVVAGAAITAGTAGVNAAYQCYG